jgi:DNA-binding CsgD family transcriptional regulator
MTPCKSQHTELEEADIAHPMETEGVLVVDLAFDLVACDRGAGAILNGSLGGVNGRAHLPTEIRDLLGAQPSTDLASLIFHLNIGDQDYCCRTFLVEPLNGNGQQIVLALHLKRAASLSDALHEVSEEYRLTDRERQALGGIALGLTTKALAKQMNISPNTVNAFLRLIMIKMGVTTRAGVVGKVLEQNGAAASKDFRAAGRGGFHA